MSPDEFVEMIARLHTTGELQEPDELDTRQSLDRAIYQARKITGGSECWLHESNVDLDCIDCCPERAASNGSER